MHYLSNKFSKIAKR